MRDRKHTKSLSLVFLIIEDELKYVEDFKSKIKDSGATAYTASNENEVDKLCLENPAIDFVCKIYPITQKETVKHKFLKNDEAYS